MWMLLYNPPKRARDLGPESAWNRGSYGSRKAVQRDSRQKCVLWLHFGGKLLRRSRGEKKKFRTKWLHKLCLVESSDFFAVANRSEILLRVLINHRRAVPAAKQTACSRQKHVSLRWAELFFPGGVNRKYPEEKDGYIIRHTRIEFLNYKCCAYYIITETWGVNKIEI